MFNLKTSLIFKISTIIVISLLLMIPTGLIKSLIQERESIQNEAITEVSSKWATNQSLIGPMLSIPYDKIVKEFSEKTKTEKLVKVPDFIHILPSELTIKGDVHPEKRYRGIYEIVVYTAKIQISGEIPLAELKSQDIAPENIHFDKAEFVIGLSDLRGLEKQVQLKWNNHNINFDPGVTSTQVIKSGIKAPVGLMLNDTLNHKFLLNIDLKGSQSLYFTPVGKTSDVELNSSWNNPSFNGAFLPDTREINQTGFHSHWNVLHLNRNYPQIWVGDRFSIDPSAFGVDLILPVDSYQKSYRSIHYAILFILFTFLVFFFIEVLNSVFIHPVQYLLVGIALIVFYTLLLSISEHLSYNTSFLISAAGTMLLIGGYVKAILKSNPLTLLLTGILSILYIFIFVIIQLQDYALLIGSIGIFLILCIVMYFSRKIDWYNLQLGKPTKERHEPSQEIETNKSD